MTCPNPETFCGKGKKFCKNWCSSKGYCLGGVCNCIRGYGGEDCSIKGSELESCNVNGKTIDDLFLTFDETRCYSGEDEQEIDIQDINEESDKAPKLQQKCCIPKENE